MGSIWQRISSSRIGVIAALGLAFLAIGASMLALLTVLGHELVAAEVCQGLAAELVAVGIGILGVTLVLQWYEAKRWEGVQRRLAQNLNAFLLSSQAEIAVLLRVSGNCEGEGWGEPGVDAGTGLLVEATPAKVASLNPGSVRLLGDTMRRTGDWAKHLLDDFREHLSPAQYTVLWDMQVASGNAAMRCWLLAQRCSVSEEADERLRPDRVTTLVAAGLTKVLTLLTDLDKTVPR